jgi:hypothetical protein
MKELGIEIIKILKSILIEFYKTLIQNINRF